MWNLRIILYTVVCKPLTFWWTPAFKELQESVLNGIDHMPFHMSRKCEKLLKKFFILNPSKKGTLELIRKDPWINRGREDEPNLAWSHSLDSQEPWWWRPMWQKARSPRLTEGWKHNQVMAICCLWGTREPSGRPTSSPRNPRPGEPNQQQPTKDPPKVSANTAVTCQQAGSPFH